MKLSWSEENSIFFTQTLVLAFIFFIPISISLKSIFLGLSLAALLLIPHYRKHIFYAYNTLWARAAALLFVFILIACLWSPAPLSMQWALVSKYLKLIYFPLLALAFINPKLRNWAVNCYLAAMLLTCILSILKARGFILAGTNEFYKSNGFIFSNDSGEVFFNHIVTGLMMALTSYLAGVFAFQNKGWLRVVYAGIFLLTSYQILFLNAGRTGYIVYFILVSLLLAQNLSFKKAISVLFLFCGILALVYTQSTMLQTRAHDSVQELLDYKSNKKTSLGYRLQFHQYAQSLFKEHPLSGIGTGGFKYRFIQDNPVPAWGVSIADPHSQYWMILSEQGLAGLICLLFFLAALVLTSFQLEATRPILLGMLVVFCIGAMTDTLLCFSTLGYLLLLMSALCSGELIEQQVNRAVLSPGCDLFRRVFQ